MTDISIIVPIYNAEKYLDKCISSLINQTKKELEFILINDGSTDESEKIIKKYKDKRIKYFKNKNQGIGKTRNFGIDKATGKYIIFLDSDDYLAENTCEELYKRAEKNKLDVVVFDFYRVENNKLVEVKINDFKDSSLKENPNLLFDINLGPCNKLFKTEVIKKNNIKFIEDLKYEDAPFVAETLKEAKKIGKLNKFFHYYVIHEQSETTVRNEKIFDIIKIVDIIRNTFKDLKYMKEVVDKLTVRILTNYTIQQRNQENIKTGMKFIDEAFNYLKKEVPDYKDNKYYEDRSFIRKIIEKNKLISKVYCGGYSLLHEEVKKDSHENKMKNITKAPSFQLSAMILSYFLVVLVAYSILQICNINNGLLLIQTLGVLIPVITYWIKSSNSKKIKIFITIIYMLLMVALPFLYSHTYDLTVDGNSYHKTAIAYIKNGWNPLYEDIREFSKDNDKVIPIDKESKLDLWIEHYPKATWVSAATTYSMTGSIESGKFITFVLSLALVLITYNILKQVIPRIYSLGISLLVALNPITLSQTFSYYLDSLMGILFTIELLLLFTIKPMKKQNTLIWLMLCATAALFVNLKFTGLLYSGIIAAVFYFYWIFKYLKEKEFWKKFLIITRNFIIVFVVAIFLVGANSYIKNGIEHLNPLYPLIGKDKVDIITTMQPDVFNRITIPQKFVWSLFAKTENITQYSKKEPTLKWPTRLYRSEIEELSAPDVRIAGFGPFFALAFIFTTLVFIMCIVKLYKNDKSKIKYVGITAATIIISMILVGESWWARYVPQMYLYTVGTILLALTTIKYFKKKIVPYLGILLIVGTLGLNILVFAIPNYITVKSFVQIERDLEIIDKMDNPKIKIPMLDLYGYLYNLRDRNIEYTRVKTTTGKASKYMYCWRLEVVEDEEIPETD